MTLKEYFKERLMNALVESPLPPLPGFTPQTDGKGRIPMKPKTPSSQTPAGLAPGGKPLPAPSQPDTPPDSNFPDLHPVQPFPKKPKARPLPEGPFKF